MYIPLDVIILSIEFIVVGFIFWLACSYFWSRGYLGGVWEGSNHIINTLVDRKIVSRDPKNGRIVRFNSEHDTLTDTGNQPIGDIAGSFDPTTETSIPTATANTAIQS